MILKGKPLSLLSKLLAVFFVLLCFCVNVFTSFNIPMDDVIKVALFMALVFSPVDISLWMETFAGIRGKPVSPGDDAAPPADASEAAKAAANGNG
jgi:hypothetical protein